MYNILVNNFAGPSIQAAINAAVARWQQVITGDLIDIVSPTYGYIDDLVIDISLINDDGAGGTLASAQVDERLHPVAGKMLPSHGSIEIDSGDLADMIATGQIFQTILHEIGHVIGLGGEWQDLGLSDFASYVGPLALAEYRLLTGDFTSNAIPLEVFGGSGSNFVHWREELFGAEIMTPYAEGGSVTEPLSRLTIAALADMGYTVNYSAADAYSVTLPGTAAPLDVVGSKRSDELLGGNGNDTLNGRKGNDSLYGFYGSDTIICGKGNDFADGGFGNDTMYGGKGDDELSGDFGNDHVEGGKGSDGLFGDEGADTLVGGKGSDYIDGGIGNDTLYGNKGKDTFHFGNASGDDVIADFRPGKDTIDVGIAGIFSFGQLVLSQVSAGTLIDFGASQVTLIGVNPWDLSSKDFTIG